MAVQVKFLQGSADEYKALIQNGTIEENTFYLADNDLYLGTTKLSNQAEIDAAINRIDASDLEIAGVKQSLTNFINGQFATLSGKVTTAESNITKAQGDISALDTLTKTHTTNISNLQTTVNGHTTDIANAQNSIAGLEQTVATKAAQTALQAEIDRATGAETQLASDLAAEIARATGVEADHEERLKKADAFFATVETPDEVIDTLQEIVNYIGTDKSGAEEMLASLNQAKTDITNLDAAYKAADSALDTKIGVNATAIEGLGGRVKDLEDASKDHSDRIGQAETDLRAVEVVAAGADGKADANASAIEDLQGDLEAAVEALEGADEAAKGRLDSLEAMVFGGSAGSGETLDDKIAAGVTEAVGAAKTYTDQEIEKVNGEIAKKTTLSAVQGWVNEQEFASKAQGALADTALQVSDIATGSTPGTISVRNSDVAVFGLGSAAYAEATDFEAAGTAEQVHAAINAEVAKKADKTYVDDELAKKADASTMTEELGKKADQNYVTTELAKKADAEATTTTLNLKANKAEVESELAKKANQSALEALSGVVDTKANAEATTNALALKANAAEVEAALETKAEKEVVESQLALKANKSDVEGALELKANKTDLDAYATKTEVALKADTSSVNSSLALKADKTDLEAYATKANVESGLNTKADKTETANALALKADKSDLTSKVDTTVHEALAEKVINIEKVLTWGKISE